MPTLYLLSLFIYLPLLVRSAPSWIIERTWEAISTLFA